VLLDGGYPKAFFLQMETQVWRIAFVELEHKVDLPFNWKDIFTT
jgi:hypothetical protein